MIKKQNGIATASLILIIVFSVGLAGSTFYFYTRSQDWKEDYSGLREEYDLLRGYIDKDLMEETVNIVAVSEDRKGILATLTVELTPGGGDIFVKSGPLIGFDFQDAQVDAVRAAANFTGFSVAENGNGIVNLHIHFIASAKTDGGVVISRIDGPSAGAAATVATIAALRRENIRKDVVITGTISSEGFIGRVSGVMEKAEAAEEANMEVFLVPEGQTVYIDGNREPLSSLKSYASEQGWNLKIIEVSKLEEATEYFNLSGPS